MTAGFKKNNPDCICCDQTGPTDPCGLFSDNFNRADSSTVGNGWTGSGSIAGNELNVGGGIAISPVNGGPDKLIEASCYFTGTNQEFRIYWGGAGNYVGYRPTNYDSSTKKNLYIFSEGVVKSAVDIFQLGSVVGARQQLSVCITDGQVTGTASGGQVRHATTSMPTGFAGVGGSGNFSNGLIRVEDFAVRVVGDACHACDDAECLNCSGAYSWLVDLSAYTGLVDYYDAYDTLIDCAECYNGLGVYLLEPIETGGSPGIPVCHWVYQEVFCDGTINAGPGSAGGGNSGFVLTVAMSAGGVSGPTSTTTRVDYRPCGGTLSISIAETSQYFDFNPIGQNAFYRSAPHSFDLAGSGQVTFTLYPEGWFFDRNANPPGTIFFNDPPCVVESHTTPDGITHHTPFKCPEIIIATRVG